MDNPSRKLSEEVRQLIAGETKKNIDEVMDYIKEKLIEILEENSQKLEESKKKSLNEAREDMTDLILKKYIPLKNQLSVLEKTLLSEDEKEEGKDKMIKNLMDSSFTERTTYYEDVKKNYDEKLAIFIDESINNYIEVLNKKIKDIELNDINKDFPKFNERVESLRKQIYILEKYYKEGQPVRLIKLDMYKNERRFLYDKRELLQGMSDYFTNYFSIIDLFS